MGKAMEYFLKHLEEQVEMAVEERIYFGSNENTHLDPEIQTDYVIEAIVEEMVARAINKVFGPK